MLLGETIYSGADPHCPDCSKKLENEVLKSNAGYYIGTQCCCGPYSRESHYYRTFELAKHALKTNKVNWRT